MNRMLRGWLSRDSLVGTGWTSTSASGWVLADESGILARGTETGPEGIACADRAALATGFAITHTDGSIEWPPLPGAPHVA